jgi:hypothetical protein
MIPDAGQREEDGKEGGPGGEVSLGPRRMQGHRDVE